MKFFCKNIKLSTIDIWQDPKYASSLSNKCDALRNMVSFVQFKKREKHPWRSVSFSKVAENFHFLLSHLDYIFSWHLIKVIQMNVSIILDQFAVY